MKGLIHLLLLIMATVYLAFAYKNTTIMLLAYLEVALFVVSFFCLLVRRWQVRVRLEVPVGIAENGRNILVKLTLWHRGRLPILRSMVKLVVKDVFRGEKKSVWMRLPPIQYGENAVIQHLVLRGSGNYDVCLEQLRLYDVTGLFHFTKNCRQECRVQIMPEIYSVPVRLTAATRNFYGESDIYDEHTPGHDNSELFQVREYRPGDRLQNVHWKLSAKQEELMVKEHSLPRACPVVFLLDYHPVKKRRGYKDWLPFLDVAASLSFSMMDAGCPHYVSWYDAAKKDIVRVRVDNEESLYYLLGSLMAIQPVQTKEQLSERYKERYRMEPYVWMLSLNEQLQLKKQEELLAGYSGKNLEEALAAVELLL